MPGFGFVNGDYSAALPEDVNEHLFFSISAGHLSSPNN
jgi:hypothetical protein